MTKLNSAVRVFPLAAGLALLGAQSHAAIVFYGVSPQRWGLTGGAIGVGNATVEDFEDVTLAPGLKVLWESPAGNFGPTSVLPNTFNPSTDDGFGNAFVGGNFGGSRCLLNTRSNDTFTYSDSPSYGDVTFLFDPPVRIAGFSVHQNESDLGLIVNGVNKGALSTLTGLAPNGGKYGYVLVKADGADTISSIKIKNGIFPSGDGFTFDHVAFSTEPGPTLLVDGFQPSIWGADDATLGVAGALTEDFEDVSLVPGLSISWEAPAGNIGPSTTLPHLFNPNTDDPFGTAFIGGNWDGSRCVISGRGNQSFAYNAGSNWGDIILHFASPQRRVGFSVQQMDRNARLVVNGRDVGDFTQVSNLDFNGGRQGYVRLNGKAGTRISSVRIANSRVNGFGDGISIDHVAIGGGCFQDLNGDQQVDDADFPLFVSAYNILDCADPAMPVDCPADFNTDGLVDDADFTIFVLGYNALLCP